MKLPCYLIRDLLPLYHDRVLADQTAADVKEHLDSCADCRTALAALDTETEAETALAAAQTRTETDALRRVRGTLRRRRWLPALAVGVLALVILAAGVLGFRRWALGTMLEVQPEDIAQVYCTDAKDLEVQMMPDKAFTALSATYVTIQDGTGTHDAAVFTMQVDLWSSLIHSGWRGDDHVTLFHNVPDTVDEAYFVRWDDWSAVMKAAQGTDGSYVMTEIPDSMYPIWQRSDAATAETAGK